MQNPNKIQTVIAIIAVLLLGMAKPSFASNDTAYFQDQIVDEGVAMDLRGLGKKNFFFMKVFIAAFYLDKEASIDKAMDPVAKRVEVSYFYPIAGQKLSDYTYNKMKTNLTATEFSGLDQEIERMRSYFPDLKSGDRYALTYIPDIGTKFTYNGKDLGVIKSPIFAKGIFSVWIGEDPMDEHIRDQILGFDSLNPKKESDVIVLTPTHALGQF